MRTAGPYDASLTPRHGWAITGCDDHDSLMDQHSYSYRQHPWSGERLYELRPEGVAWAGEGAKGSFAYRDVAEVAVFKKRFLGSSATYWTCVLLLNSGGKVRLSAANRTGYRTVEDRTPRYIPFVQELEARIAAAKPDARFVRGRHWLGNVETATGYIAVAVLRSLRYVPLNWAAALAGRIMRMVGPRLRGQRTVLSQLAAVYPEKPREELKRIAIGMWDNLGRTSAEYAHLDRIWDNAGEYWGGSRIVMDEENAERWRRIAASGRPALMFAAHLANWELPPLAAPALGREIALVYRTPFIGPVADELTRIRGGCVAALFPADRNTPLRIREALRRGWLVGMLVDQHYARGIDVTLFDRQCKVNPLLARLAQQLECPIHGSRVVRLPGERFRFEVTEALPLPRDADGEVDVAATMQLVTSMIEGWVREHPEQWLWLHRRWP